MLEIIRKLAGDYRNEIVEYRNHIHANPELSFVEYETSAYIQKLLKSFNIQFQVMANTGVVALIEGKNPRKKITALRADIDALPILEKNEVAYKSTRPGIMHACGHDVHTA
ncbi:MAG: M20/M25/M40 family metallo-hydrolase [Ferruginibacter sp.]